MKAHFDQMLHNFANQPIKSSYFIGLPLEPLTITGNVLFAD